MDFVFCPWLTAWGVKGTDGNGLGQRVAGCVVEPGVLDPQKLDDLLSRVAYGDEAAFAEFYDQVAGLLYSLAFAITEVWRTAPRYSPAAGGGPARGAKPAPAPAGTGISSARPASGQ